MSRSNLNDLDLENLLFESGEKIRANFIYLFRLFVLPIESSIDLDVFDSEHRVNTTQLVKIIPPVDLPEGIPPYNIEVNHFNSLPFYNDLRKSARTEVSL